MSTRGWGEIKKRFFKSDDGSEEKQDEIFFGLFIYLYSYYHILHKSFHLHFIFPSFSFYSSLLNLDVKTLILHKCTQKNMTLRVYIISIEEEDDGVCMWCDDRGGDDNVGEIFFFHYLSLLLRWFFFFIRSPHFFFLADQIILCQTEKLIYLFISIVCSLYVSFCLLKITLITSWVPSSCSLFKYKS